MFFSYFPVVNLRVYPGQTTAVLLCILSLLSLSLSLFLSLSVQSVCVLAVKHFDGVEADVCFVYSGMDGCLSELEPW